MRRMKSIFRCVWMLAIAWTGTAAPRETAVTPQDFVVGADISGVQAAEALGVKYSDKGVAKDILAILKDHGFNYVRLRVFVDPTKATPRDRPYSTQGFCDLPHTIEWRNASRRWAWGC